MGPLAPMHIADYLTSHSIDLYRTTEDLTERSNRVAVGTDGSHDVSNLSVAALGEVVA